MTSTDRIEVLSEVPIPEHGVDQITYAAAFIDPAVRAVSAGDEGWRFTLNAPVEKARLEQGLRRLIDRFSGEPAGEAAPLFEITPLADWPSEGHLNALRESGAIQEIDTGLFVYREPLSTLLRFLDDAILRRFARPFGAREECYPNAIPIASLARADHMASFPEHLHFLTHLTLDLNVLDGFAARARAGEGVAPGEGEISRIELVQNPSTCYHCYAARRGERLAGDMVVTAATKCHRFEAANHSETGRLLEFTLREVIFLGTPVFVREGREMTVGLMRELAGDWQLAGRMVPANDPFFTSDYDIKATHQQRMRMKYEYRARLSAAGEDLAVMSSNLHGPTFGKAFDINRDGRAATSGCLGFGLERLALAIVAQHGAEPSDWPPGLARDYASWEQSWNGTR